MDGVQKIGEELIFVLLIGGVNRLKWAYMPCCKRSSHQHQAFVVPIRSEWLNLISLHQTRAQC